MLNSSVEKIFFVLTNFFQINSIQIQFKARIITSEYQRTCMKMR